MFDNLSGRLEGIVKKIKGKGPSHRGADVDEVMKEIRSALLEADVNVSVVRSLCNRIRETRHRRHPDHRRSTRASRSSRPVNDELTRALGGETLSITFAAKPPTVVLMAGLQGSGKTTNSAKLAGLVQGTGTPAAARRSRPPTPGSGRAAPHARRTDRRARLLRPGGSDPHRAPGPGRGQAPRTRRVDRRHRRPPVDRLRDDGAGPPDLGRRRPRLHVPRHRRHDRSGRGTDGGGVPRDPRRSTA